MTRQREWQKRRLAAGLCERCGKPRTHYRAHCDGCAVKHKELVRRANGCTKRYRTRADADRK